MKHSLICFFFFLFSGTLIAGDSEKVSFPILDKIGVIPPQVEETYSRTLNLEEALDVMKPEIFRTVKDSKRFFVISDELVRSLWDSKPGREALLEDNEISLFLSVTFLPKPDSLMILARLLDPNLNLLLQESDTFARVEVQKASTKEQQDMMRALIFRLLNRLPIDSYVKSIQGSVVTLQGGKSQGILIGQEFTVNRLEISEITPGTGEWSRFKSFPRGRVKIIETEDESSVALILSQEFDNSIQVGNGFEVSSLPGRHYFKSTQPVPEPVVIASAVQLAPPSALEEILASPAEPRPPKPEVSEPKAPLEPKAPEAPEEQREKPQTKSEGMPQEKRDPPAAPTLSYQETAPSKPHSEPFALRLLYGYSDWELSGELEEAGEFHLVPLGLGASVEGHLFGESLGFEVAGEFEQGSVKSTGGRSLLLSGDSKLFYQTEVLSHLSLRLGGRGYWTSLDVSEDHFGGLWLLGLGGFSAISWPWALTPEVPLSFTVEAGVDPLNFGSLSYGASESGLVPALGWNCKLGVKWDRPLWMRLKPGLEAGFSYKHLVDEDDLETDLNQISFKLFVEAQL